MHIHLQLDSDPITNSMLGFGALGAWLLTAGREDQVREWCSSPAKVAGGEVVQQRRPA
jgi:hypothetical protein